MNGEISLLAAIIWAVISGLFGVGIGICIMCLCFIARRGDVASEVLERMREKTDRDNKSWNVVLNGLQKSWPSDLAKGKSAKTGMS